MEGWKNSRRLLRFSLFLLTALATVNALLVASYINTALTRPTKDLMQEDESVTDRQRSKATVHGHTEDTMRTLSIKYSIESSSRTTIPRLYDTDLYNRKNIPPAQHMIGEQIRVGYLLAMVYAEQLSSATKHYASLINIAVEWGMKSVEPLITVSRLYGTQCIYGDNANRSFYRYSRFFNMAQVDRELSECLIGANVSIISSRPDFLYSSYRDIVVVHFVHRRPLPVAGYCGNIHGNKPYLQEFEKSGKGMIDCTGVALREGLQVAVERTLNEELDRNEMSGVKRFHVRNVICVDSAKEVSLNRLKELIQSSGNSTGHESVVFVYWQGGVTADFLMEKNNFSRCSVSAVQHSDEVSNTALKFVVSLGLKRPFLSVHIRSEKIMETDFYHHGYKNCCLRRLHSLIDKVMMRHDLQNVLLVRDYGKYGTESCFLGSFQKYYAVCRNISDHMMQEIGEWGIKYTAFDPVKFRTLDNSGFVSLVESDALLQGSVLLTAGFGEFQNLLRERFSVHQASLSRLYSVCSCYREPAEALHGLLQEDSCDSLIP